MSKEKIKREIPTPADSPWKHDEYNREILATNLTHTINTYEPPIVVSVNGEWGTGKTTFIKMWEASLKLKGSPVLQGKGIHETLYFNAWEHDFSLNPLMAFIYRLIESHKPEIDEINEFAEKMINSGIALAKSITKNLMTIGTGSLINTAAINATAQAYKKETNTTPIEQNKHYKSIKQDLDHMSELKKYFKQYVSLRTSDNQPLIIFIDELDRCKPSWAIQLLEAIKHLFCEAANVVIYYRKRSPATRPFHRWTLRPQLRWTQLFTKNIRFRIHPP